SLLEFPFFGFSKKFDVLGVGPRPSTLDVVHSERIELLGNAQLVHHREIDPFTLAAIAQSGIVYFDFWSHAAPPERGGIFMITSRGCKVQRQAIDQRLVGQTSGLPVLGASGSELVPSSGFSHKPKALYRSRFAEQTGTVRPEV